MYWRVGGRGGGGAQCLLLGTFEKKIREEICLNEKKIFLRLIYQRK